MKRQRVIHFFGHSNFIKTIAVRTNNNILLGSFDNSMRMSYFLLADSQGKLLHLTWLRRDRQGL